MTTTAQKLIRQYIFGGFEGQFLNEESIEDDIDKLEEEEKFKGARRPSAYVDVFENVARTVLEHERHLLSQGELEFIEQFSRLCYNTRYCLVRLVLRKPGLWHSISNLEKFKREVGEEGLHAAIADLCKPVASLVKQEAFEDAQTQIEKEDVGPILPPVAIKTEPPSTEFRVRLEENGREIIDLTMDDDEEVKPDVSSSEVPTSSNARPHRAGPSNPQPPSNSSLDVIQALLESSNGQLDLSFFCEDESAMSLQEILERLNVDQIKALMKEMKCKVKPQSKKSDMIATLLSTATSQSVLSFAPGASNKGKGKARDDGLRQTLLPFSSSYKKPLNQVDRLKQMAMKPLGKCIRVNMDIFRFVRRLHIIGYRETEHPTALLLPELLNRFKKRSYTKIDHTRSSNIWTSRDEIIAYEKALHLENLLDEVIEGLKDKDKAPQARAQSRMRVKEEPNKSVTPGPNKHLATPLRTPGNTSNLRTSTPSVMKAEDEQELKNCHPEGDYLDELAAEIKKEALVKMHIDSWLYDMCRESVSRYTALRKEVPPGFERFSSGYVLIRMLGKAVSALGPLKEYEQELEILDLMLSQNFWRRGKRAEWYRRKAIIYGHLIRQADTKDKKWELQKRSMLGLRVAILDDDVGIVLRPDLINRLMKLEKQLNLPPEQRSICDGQMSRPETIQISAIKISTPLKFDSLGRLIEEKENTPDLLAYMVPKNDLPKLEDPMPTKKTGKSCWQGKNGIVNVETIALEHYEALGYTGFHSETKLLTTIFGLLFWDIIFAKVPGAFETPFQFAPLDMFEDTFYHARKDLIDARLMEIKTKDGWKAVLQRHDDAYREKKTWCIGVNWDLCTKEDLFDIFKCIGAESLATICQLFCQDYRGRQSGGPDLFVWNATQGLCKFVEVKGPGDRPQENQKYWFDSLHRANVSVEICRVVDDSDKAHSSATVTKKRKAKTPSAQARRKSAPADTVSDEVDYEALVLDQEDNATLLAPDYVARPTRKRRRISEPACKVEEMDHDHLTLSDASAPELAASSRSIGADALFKNRSKVP